MKKYIFVLCPPFHGSTIIVNLLSSSSKVSSLMSVQQHGESQWLYKKHGDTSYEDNRWDPNYNLDMDMVKNIFDIYFDNEKTFFVEKSPPMICRAEKFQEYFSKFGEVYFIISIRNPYSVNDNNSIQDWVKFAEYQKKNIETLKNTIVTSYEEICLHLDNFILKIQEKIPELDDMKNWDNHLAKNTSFERTKMIHDNKVNRYINKEEKTPVLKKNIELLHYFGYEILE